MDGDAQPQRVTLVAQGSAVRDSVRGEVYGQPFISSFIGGRVQFAVGSYLWWGQLRGDTLRGYLTSGTGTDSSAWIATRYRPPAVARSFVYAPAGYRRGLSSDVSPVLRLYAGDTVRTTTVDASGRDANAASFDTPPVTSGGNPLTGPFYIEGAVPGDVLVVRLLRVRLNRGWAFSGTSLVDGAIQPSYAVERRNTPMDRTWLLDTIAAMARLRTPSSALNALRIPLRPFLGAIGVATGGASVPSSRDSGPFGGNMEVAHLHEGATLYLPVTTMGAYLYLGDGHAAQGDGELTGDAMETSLDVTFTIGVKRWGFASIPRAETVDEIMSIGVAGSLDEATRQATSDLARWLEADFAVTATDVALMLGFAVRYDIADLVAPWLGVTARLPKSILQTLPRR